MLNFEQKTPCPGQTSGVMLGGIAMFTRVRDLWASKSVSHGYSISGVLGRSMSMSEVKMQPWQVFHAAIKAIGAENVARIFNREKRSAYNWGQDPMCTEVRCKSPLELLHTLLERMDAMGYGYVARSAVRYLETAIDHDTVASYLVPLKATIQEEILADYSAVAALQRAIECGSSIDRVKELKREAIDEIERTVARYGKQVQQ